MALDDVVNVAITEAASPLTGPGFGTPLVLGAHHGHFGMGELLRYYTSAAAMLSDGFLATDQTYLEVASMFQQRPTVERVAVGERPVAVAQVINVTVPASPADGAYTITITGALGPAHGTFNASSSTQAQVVAGLVAALNNSGVHGVTLVTASDHATAHTSVDLTADTAGAPFTVSLVSPSSTMAQTTSTANVGIPEALDAIQAYQPDWYGLVITQRDDGNVMAAATHIEGMSSRHIFLAQSSAAAILSAPYSAPGAGVADADVASHLRTLGYARTSLWYDATDAATMASAMMARGLASVPGGITWKFKQLIGVAAFALTTTQRTNLLSKNANSYEPLANQTMTFEGTVGDGEFIDVIHGIDHLHSLIQLGVGSILSASPKVPYTQAGINLLAGAVRSALKQKELDGLIAESRVLGDGTLQRPAYTVTPPKISDISASDRAGRTIPAGHPIVFEGTLAGAIHAVHITGTLSV